MLFHASIGARDPAHVAAVVAEIWQGAAYPFPPFPDSYIALAGDERGSAIEIYPLGQVLVPGEDEARARLAATETRNTETHLAIGTPLGEEELHWIAQREGWLSRTCDRGGKFHVVEIWVENRLMIEALTPEMQKEYRDFATPERWEALLVELGVRLDACPRARNRAELPATVCG